MQLNGLFSFLGKSFMTEGEEAAKSADGSGHADRFGAALAAAFGLRAPHDSNLSGEDPDAAESAPTVAADGDESSSGTESDASSSTVGTLAAATADAAAPTDAERADGTDPSALKGEGSAPTDGGGADRLTTPTATKRSPDLPDGAQSATEHQSQNPDPSSTDADRPSEPSNPSGAHIAAGQDGQSTDDAQPRPPATARASESLPRPEAGVHAGKPASDSSTSAAASPSSEHTGDRTDGARTVPTGNAPSDDAPAGDQPGADVDVRGTANAAEATAAGDERAASSEPKSRRAEMPGATTPSARTSESPPSEVTPAAQHPEGTQRAHQTERPQSTPRAGHEGAPRGPVEERLEVRIPEGKSDASLSPQDEAAEDASRTERVPVSNSDPNASSSSPATARETATSTPGASNAREGIESKQPSPVRAAEPAPQNAPEPDTASDPEITPTSLDSDGTEGDATDAALKNADAASRSSANRDSDGVERRDASPKTSPAAQGDRAFSQGHSDMSSDSDNPAFTDPRNRTTIPDAGSDFEASIESISTEEIPVDAELPPDETTFSPEQKTTLAALSTVETTRGSSRPQAPGSMAWLRTILGQSTKALELAQGWKAIEVQLEDGMGTMTVRARRGDDGVTVSVSFSDPTLRSLAENNIHRLQDALRAEYEANVDLSLMSDGSQDSPSRQDQTDRGRPSPSVGNSAGLQDAESASEPSSVRRPAMAGVRNEWIG